jgi:hypothetical protein
MSFLLAAEVFLAASFTAMLLDHPSALLDADQNISDILPVLYVQTPLCQQELCYIAASYLRGDLF